ncbi:MAG TPA: DUF2269 family protein [Gaiellaceae bacterium]|nr:DUF2269 family protein [Gaiellaceae bacterium]
MTTYQWLLAFHVLAAMLFVSGGAMVGFLHAAALRSDRPSAVAALLGLTRVGVLVVVAGALGSLALGLALVFHLPEYDLGDAWIVLSLLLWTGSVALGAAGGRPLRRARYLAQELGAAGAEVSPALRRALANPVALALNYASMLAALAVLGLMIWKPA